MADEPNDATPFLPERRSLEALREAAAGCRGCHLWRPATQAAFGEGRRSSRPAAQTPKRFEIDACMPWLEAELAPVVSATLHPSAILRQRDEAARVAEREAFAADLRVVGRVSGSLEQQH